MKYVYYDLETTGLSPKNCTIIQIGAICGNQCFETLVNPEEQLSAKIVELTGISQDSVDKCDVSLRQAMGELLTFMASAGAGERVRLVAYNGFAFDSRFIYHALQATHLQPQFEAVCEGFCDPLLVLRSQVATRDTSTWVRNKRGKACLKLGSVYQSLLGCSFDDAHTALADSRALQDICVELALHTHGMPVTNIAQWCDHCTRNNNKRRRPMPLILAKKVKL